jgi:urease accessory protein
MRAVRIAASTAAVLATTEAAFAHPPPFGVPGFFGGLLHPLFVPAHFMAVLGIGLLIGQQAPAWGRAAPSVFILALIAGLAVLTTGVVPRWGGECVLLLALIAGVLTALARPLPEQFGCGLAAAMAVAIGLDSPPEVLSVRTANLMLIGTALGGTVLMVAVTEIATRLTHPWQRTAARVLGSWIAASAILVLALRLAG